MLLLDAVRRAPADDALVLLLDDPAGADRNLANAFLGDVLHRAAHLRPAMILAFHAAGRVREVLHVALLHV